MKLKYRLREYSDYRLRSYALHQLLGRIFDYPERKSIPMCTIEDLNPSDYQWYEKKIKRSLAKSRIPSPISGWDFPVPEIWPGNESQRDDVYNFQISFDASAAMSAKQERKFQKSMLKWLDKNNRHYFWTFRFHHDSLNNRITVYMKKTSTGIYICRKDPPWLDWVT